MSERLSVTEKLNGLAACLKTREGTYVYVLDEQGEVKRRGKVNLLAEINFLPAIDSLTI